MRWYVDAHRTFATFAKLAARIERGSLDLDHYSSRHIACPRRMVGDGPNIQVDDDIHLPFGQERII